MSDYYLAIDQGGHASRAIVFDEHGNLITQAEHAIQTYTPKPDWVEHDATELLQATRAAINNAVDQLGADKQRLRAAGLATQRSSIVCWHKQSGRPLSPVISWQDRRQAEWLQQFQEHGELIHQHTGLFLSPHYGAGKMRWCLGNLTEVQQAQRDEQLVIAPLAAFLAYQLLQEHPLVVDPANASRTLLWNLASRDWDDTLLQLFGIPEQILPPCGTSRGPFGHVIAEGVLVPLNVITGDQSAALFAWGAPKPENCYINMGTGAFIQRPMNSAVSTERLLTGIAYQDDTQGWYTLEGTVNGAARALHWYSERYGVTDIKQHVTEALASNEIPALFVNTVSGLGSPDWQSRLEPVFEGADTTTAQLLGVVESIVFLIQRNLDEMQKSVTPPQQIVVSGGVSLLDGVCQRIADLSQSRVVRPVEHEATAAGLAWLLAQRTNHLASQHQGATFTAQPNPALSQRYRDWSARLEQLITAKA